MRKFAAVVLSVCALFVMFSSPVWAEPNTELKIASPSAEFLEWQRSQRMGMSHESISDATGQSSTNSDSIKRIGHVLPIIPPAPVDLSHLDENPPIFEKHQNSTRENISDAVSNSPATLPVSYDIRRNGWVPPVRDQAPFGTCWAFASLGSMESNYLVNVKSGKYRDVLGVGTNPHMSVMHLAWFAYKDSKEGAAFYIDPQPFRWFWEESDDPVLDQGGHPFKSTAFLSRIGGAVAESELPYPSSKGYTEPNKKAEEYPCSLRLMDVAYLAGADASGLTPKASSIEFKKRMIIEKGAIQVSYYHTNNELAYFDNNHDTKTNHAVLLVGWNDNFSPNNFGNDEIGRPTQDGAWLVRNSWGDEFGNKGYFWISYEQYLRYGAAHTVEPADSKLHHYGYDDLGWCASTGVGAGKPVWAANVFQMNDDNESLKDVAFYTTDNNAQYELYIYNLGTDKPSSPVDGVLLYSKNDTIPIAGYHTVTLPTLIPIQRGAYFSVVLKMTTPVCDFPVALEKKVAGYSDGAVFHRGESYFGGGYSTPTEWMDGYDNKLNDTPTPVNACIKAFTTKTEGVLINETNFPDPVFRTYITEKFDTDVRSVGTLTASELARATYIFVPSQNIYSLKGIEFLTALRTVDCSNTNITELDVSGHAMLTSLNVSGCTQLKTLECDNCSLSTLDINGCSSLTRLSCMTNHLSTLTLDACPALAELYCYGNKFTTLDLSGHPLLTSLNCRSQKVFDLSFGNSSGTSYEVNLALYIPAAKLANVTSVKGYDSTGNTISTTYNQSTGIITLSAAPEKVVYQYDTGFAVSGMKMLMDVTISTGTEIAYPVAVDIPIDEVHFPDANFRSYVSKEFDTSKDGTLSAGEIAKAKYIYRDTARIESLKGIEYFSALTKLNCTSNELTTLDVSMNTALAELYCGGNQLTTLDISKNTALISLSCHDNQLTTLDVSKNTALTSLYCRDNQLTTLDVSKNTALTELWCSQNQLTTLDVSKNTALTKLECWENQLTTLDVSKNTILTELWCGDNQITTLDVSKNTALISLRCDNNRLTTLNVSKNTSLQLLGCCDNQLTMLDISQNKDLTNLYCYNNHLTTLDLSKNIFLKWSYYYAQSVYGAKLVKVNSGAHSYQFDLKTYIPASKIGNVVADMLEAYNGPASANTSVNTSYKDGIISFVSKPTEVRYRYTVGYDGFVGYEYTYTDVMEVTINFVDDDDEPTPTPTIMSPTITTSALPSGKVGTAYSATLTATGTTPITWSASGLPNGVTCNAAGVISGTPKSSGTFTVAVTATNEAGSISKSLTLTIAAAGTTPTPEPAPVTPDNPTPTPTDEPDETPDTPASDTPENAQYLPPSSGVADRLESRGMVRPNTLQRSNSNVGAERNTSSLRDEEKKAVSDDNATVAAVLPEMSVNVSGTYLLGVDIDANVPTGATLSLHLFPRTAANGGVALSGETAGTFYDDEGTEITTVPSNHHVNVAVELTAGVTYAPVVTAVTSSNTPDSGNDTNENGTSGSGGGGGGGGCNAGMGALVLALLGATLLKRR